LLHKKNSDEIVFTVLHFLKIHPSLVYNSIYKLTLTTNQNLLWCGRHFDAHTVQIESVSSPVIMSSNSVPSQDA